ncbi:MAG: HAD family phosphatase [Rikenellaceae bacterium]
MKIKGVIFDMDGVLVDNKEAHEKAFSLWCRSVGLDFGDDFLSQYYGMGNDEIFPAILGRECTLEEIKKYGNDKEAIYREVYKDSIEGTAGLVELLEELHSNGIRMSVGSSAIIENVDFVLDALGIRKYFSAISHSGLVERAKPAPDIFLKAAELLGLEPEECWVFEDAPAGVRAARAAGMGLGVLTTSFSKDVHSDYDLISEDFRGVTLSRMEGAVNG